MGQQRYGRAYAVGLALAMGLFGCKRVVGEVAREVAQATSPEVKAPSVKAVSETEAQAFGEALVTAARRGDKPKLEGLIDFKVMVQRSLADLKVANAVLQQTTAGVIQGARTTGLVHQLASISERGDTIKVLQTRTDDTGRWATVRLLPAAGGFEHYDFLLDKRGNGDVVTVDVQMLTSGELMSATMGRALVSALGMDKSLLKRLSERENALLKHMPDILKAQQTLVTGDAAGAASMLEALPEKVREQKFVMLVLVQATAATGDDARYSRALSALLKAFPNDPAATVASIDHHFLTKEYDKALAAIDRVEKSTVPDPYFGVLRTNALLELDRFDDARKAIDATIDKEPDMLMAHFSLVALLLRQKAHDATAAQLLKMRETFNLEYDLAAVPEYADFVASPQYARFVNELGAK